jgi:tRNA pseudouridine55 synthase
MFKIPSQAELKKGGVLLVDKPYKWTSFDAVHSIKISLRAKIGHAGTLDPLATGLLICCTGESTKQIAMYQKLPKEYTGCFILGAITESYDLESEVTNAKPTVGITEKQVYDATESLTGDIMQVPPAHSAVKKDGKRSYDLARAGMEVVLEARPVTIGTFEITEFNNPEVHFRIVCSTGTYIRSIARDLGELLGCGAYLASLRRTQIGKFKVEDALTPEQYKAIWKPQPKPSVPEQATDDPAMRP